MASQDGTGGGPAGSGGGQAGSGGGQAGSGGGQASSGGGHAGSGAGQASSGSGQSGSNGSAVNPQVASASGSSRVADTVAATHSGVSAPPQASTAAAGAEALTGAASGVPLAASVDVTQQGSAAAHGRAVRRSCWHAGHDQRHPRHDRDRRPPGSHTGADLATAAGARPDQHPSQPDQPGAAGARQRAKRPPPHRRSPTGARSCASRSARSACRCCASTSAPTVSLKRANARNALPETPALRAASTSASPEDGDSVEPLGELEGAATPAAVAGGALVDVLA